MKPMKSLGIAMVGMLSLLGSLERARAEGESIFECNPKNVEDRPYYLALMNDAKAQAREAAAIPTNLSKSQHVEYMKTLCTGNLDEDFNSNPVLKKTIGTGWQGPKVVMVGEEARQPNLDSCKDRYEAVFLAEFRRMRDLRCNSFQRMENSTRVEPTEKAKVSVPVKKKSSASAPR